MPKCMVCGKSGEFQELFNAQEKHTGTFDTFVYGMCSNCGSLQRISQIKDMSAYYSSDSYYSFQNFSGRSVGLKNFGLKRAAGRILRAAWVEELRHNGKMLNEMCKRIYPRIHEEQERNSVLRSVLLNSKSRKDRILDVGCGDGALLKKIEAYGYKDLTGIDPYGNDEQSKNITIKKTDIYNLNTNKKFDIIIFRHSLEHMEQPYEVLLEAKRRLEANGKIFIALPMLGDAWARYKTDWVELDSPRHIILFSYKGAECLFERLGLNLEKIIYDGEAFAYTGSEMYKMNIPLVKQRKLNAADVLGRETVELCRTLSAQSNEKGSGYANRALFILTA